MTRASWRDHIKVGHHGPVKVTVRYHDGDSWTKYTMVPRGELSRFRRLGGSYRGAVRRWFDDWVHPEGWNGPGRPFWDAPRLYRRRRFLCIEQSGGLDV